MKKATQKQLKLIENIEQILLVEFTGETIEEASSFISKHLERYKEEQSFIFDMIYNENHY